MSINKSNALTQKIKHDLSAVEQKLLDMVIGKVDSKSKDFKSKEFLIDLNSFAENYTNFKHLKKVLDLMPKKILRFIENDVKELEIDEKRKVKKLIDNEKLTLEEILNFTEIPELDLIFYLETLELSKEQKRELEELKTRNKENIKKHDKKYKTIPLFASVVFLDASNFVKIEISKELMPYLINYKKEYTGLNAKDIFKLRSKYSIRIYELISSYQSLPKKNKNKNEYEDYIEVSIPYLKLKEMLSLENKYKKRYDQFRNKVLEVAKKELKEKKTDFRFDYHIKGRGDYKFIIFQIYNVKEMQDQEAAKKTQELVTSLDTVDKMQYDQIYNYMAQNFKLSEKKTNELFSKHDLNELARAIQYVDEYSKRNKVGNKTGLFLKTLNTKEWTEEYQKTKEEKKIQKKQKELPNIIDPEVKKLDQQKAKLKTDITLFFEFLTFLSKKAKTKPGGYIASILPKLQVDKNLIDTEAKLGYHIKTFFEVRGESENIR